MIVNPIKTARVTAGSTDIAQLVDTYVTDIPERSILAITSKVVALCENRIVPTGTIAKEQLVMQEADLYAAAVGQYGFSFTVANDTLIPAAGIDESNGNGAYILWPSDIQASANAAREYVRSRFNRKEIGVVITDSTCTPLRRGTSGICLAHSGFCSVNDYIGKPDLFGRPYRVSQSNVAGGLAAAAVVVMGEGTEQTPLCLIQDVPFVQFEDRTPTHEELSQLRIPLDEDIFAPFFTAVQWQRGQRGGHR